MNKRIPGISVIALGLLVGAGAVARAQELAHTETTVKHTGAGPNTKEKTETVIGTVKDYSPGKSIKVTGPGDKNYSFDLDDSAGVKGNVAVGDRVKVTYTKTDSGDRVTTVQPYK